MSESDRVNTSNGSSQGFPFSNFMITTSDHVERNPFVQDHQNPNGFDSSSAAASFTDYLHGGAVEYNTLSAAFDLHHSTNNNNVKDSRESESTPIRENLRFSPSEIRIEAQEEEEGSIANPNGDLDHDHQDQDHIKSNNLSSKVIKKKGEKKERETRFAFKTKSEIDNLEDGYRWRKYGQKAVKNSPFPRSYYRCTSLECGVKKRIERSFEEPSMVITTYEGQHNHHTPATRSAMLPPSFPTFSHPNYHFPPSSNGGGINDHHPIMNQYPINPSYYARVVNPQLDRNPNPNQYTHFPSMLSSYLQRQQP